jgi:NTE family protein
MENQIPVDALAGTSSGSIAAAAYASGCSIEELIRAARSLRWNRFARWTIPSLGFATNERMDGLLADTLRCRTFEELKIPLAVVAADLWSGEAVIFREGDLLTPVRASCSFPGLFVPIEYQGRLLVDGVLVGTVPVMALRGVDMVVAVSVRGNGSRRRPTSFFEVVGESFHVAQNLTEASWKNHCDLVIEPELGEFRWDDFSRTDELIAAGEIAARRALPALRKLLRERSTNVATRPASSRQDWVIPPGNNSPVPT